MPLSVLHMLEKALAKENARNGDGDISVWPGDHSSIGQNPLFCSTGFNHSRTNMYLQWFTIEEICAPSPVSSCTLHILSLTQQVYCILILCRCDK